MADARGNAGDVRNPTNFDWHSADNVRRSGPQLTNIVAPPTPHSTCIDYGTPKMVTNSQRNSIADVRDQNR
jgi:hypothetical protein